MKTVGCGKQCAGINKQHLHCGKCKYSISLSGSSRFSVCGYMYITGNRRGCEAGKDKCIHYEKTNKKRYIDFEIEDERDNDFILVKEKLEV